MKPDMKKVIERLEYCAETRDGYVRDCINDALDLLKEQEAEIEKLQDRLQHAVEVGEVLLEEREAVKPVRDEQTGRIWLCGKCGSYVGFEDNDPDDTNEFDKYCHECGRPVLWEGR